MKAIKILFKTVVWVVAIVVVALLLTPIWFGPVVKTAANAAVPGIVKTDFHLGRLHLNPYTARFELGDLQLANPAGYPEKYAVTLGDIIFDADMLSLATDVIHIEEITVKDVFVSVVNGGENNVGNFKQIQYNVAGGKEKYEASKVKTEDVQPDTKQDENVTEETPSETAEEEKEGPSKKIIIDKIHISGFMIQLGVLPISIPVTIELTDIGKSSGGATLEEAWQQIWAGILRSAGIVGDQLKALGGMAGDAASQATAAVGNAAGQATEAVGNVTKAAGNATKAAGDAVNQAAESLNKAAEGATKALDSLKKLW